MKSKWFSHSSVADWIKTIEFLKNNGSVFLLGLHFADFLEKLLALDSEQDELLYRICKLNLCMCQARAQCQDTGEEKWLGEIFCHLWIFFYRKKNPTTIVLLAISSCIGAFFLPSWDWSPDNARNIFKNGETAVTIPKYSEDNCQPKLEHLDIKHPFHSQANLPIQIK